MNSNTVPCISFNVLFESIRLIFCLEFFRLFCLTYFVNFVVLLFVLTLVTLKPVAPPRRMTIAHTFVATESPTPISDVQKTGLEEKKEMSNFSSRTRACDEFDPSKLSLIDRVRMFNGLAAKVATQQPNRLPVKKLVTSKRFNTQPVTTLEHLQCQECKYFILFYSHNLFCACLVSYFIFTLFGALACMALNHFSLCYSRNANKCTN